VYVRERYNEELASEDRCRWDVEEVIKSMPSWDVTYARLPGTPLRGVPEHRPDITSILQQSEVESKKRL
jgi:hypothetical protein